MKSMTIETPRVKEIDSGDGIAALEVPFADFL